MAEEVDYQSLVPKALSRPYWQRVLEGVRPDTRSEIKALLSHWNEVSREQANRVWMILVGRADYQELEQNRIWSDTQPQLILNATLEAFIARVLRYIRTQPLHRYHYLGRGYALEEPAYISWMSHLEIDATGDFMVSPEGAGTFEHRRQEVITLELRRLPLVSEVPYHRLEVKANCLHPAFHGLFGRILRAIAKHWPEAYEQLGLEPPEETPVESTPKKRIGAPPITKEAWQKRFDTVRAMEVYAENNGVSLERACRTHGHHFPSVKYWRRKMRSRARKYE